MHFNKLTSLFKEIELFMIFLSSFLLELHRKQPLPVWLSKYPQWFQNLLQERWLLELWSSVKKCLFPPTLTHFKRLVQISDQQVKLFLWMVDESIALYCSAALCPQCQVPVHARTSTHTQTPPLNQFCAASFELLILRTIRNPEIHKTFLPHSYPGAHPWLPIWCFSSQGRSH